MENRELLYKIGERGFEKRRDYIPSDKVDDYYKRFENEYNLICDLNYHDYFLIIWDIVRWSKKQGILTAPARGSVGGSLLAYLMEVTSVDPIKYDLLFERFMNPARSVFDPPDVDLDFQASRRQEVKDYVSDRYGADRVCSIGTHSYAFASNSIKDVAKIMQLDYQRLNHAIAHKLGNKTLDEAYEEVDTFQSWVKESDDNKKCFDIACNIEGMIRHRQVHAAGLIVAPSKITDYVPTIIKDGIVSTQWNMDQLQKRGLLKIDILGLSTLDVLQETMDNIPENIELLSIPFNDPIIFDMFTKGDTLTVFQFDTFHLQKVMKQLKADSFEDLIVATTICRPASSHHGITESYIKRKHGDEDIDYIHPIMETLLGNTMGFPIYQELVMKLANQGSGGELSTTDAESIRYAIKHHITDELDDFSKRFKSGAISQLNASQEQADNMWDMIQASEGYTFNRSHAAAYSMMSYYCAYFKHYYPLEYMTACLNAEGDSSKYSQIFNECKRLGLKIEPAHINKSKENFTIRDDKIYCGFNMIKSVGDVAAKEIVAHQPFRSMTDFEDKVEKRKVNIRVRRNLSTAGVFGKIEDFTEYMEAYGGYLVGDLPDWNLEDLPMCVKCPLHENRFKVVCGDGAREYNDEGNRRIPSGVMFVGEAPGFTEDKKGKPFVGKSGRLLREEWIPSLDLSLDDVYITNIVKCLPLNPNGSLGKPTQEEQNICSVWLEKEIQKLKPSVIVAIGGYAYEMLSNQKGVMKGHGKTFDVSTLHNSYPDITGFCFVHPAYVLRTGGKFDMLPAFEEFKRIINT